MKNKKGVENMKKFVVRDMVSGNVVALIKTNNGKNALRIFKQGLLSTGFYEIHKENGNWVLSSTYGSYFKAIETV